MKLQEAYDKKIYKVWHPTWRTTSYLYLFMRHGKLCVSGVDLTTEKRWSEDFPYYNQFDDFEKFVPPDEEALEKIIARIQKQETRDE